MIRRQYLGRQFEPLPNNFHDKLLELQLNLESDNVIQAQTVQQLLDLYTKAIVYYTQLEKQNYIKMFKYKTDQLLLQEKFLNVLRYGGIIQEEQNEKKLRIQREQLMANIMYMEQQIPELVRQMIKNFQKRHIENTKLIEKNLKKQKESVVSRMSEIQIKYFLQYWKLQKRQRKEYSKPKKKRKKLINLNKQIKIESFPAEFIIPF